ncbi:signal peptidase I [Natrialba sp. INN-245]|uniref:signal peptidase I n=1 Tax=Natrialba sp. INN-245 TaxID=2690967 RepID=UPI00135B312B|nr:signal peptidase I [Natrialba sp. INN-245]
MRASVRYGLTIGTVTVLVVFLALVGMVAAPGLVGGDDAFIVTSDSMSPTLEAGDVVVTRAVPADQIESGDIVTVHDGSDDDTGYVTHRVVDVREVEGERALELQGDANEEPDEGLVPDEYVTGTLHLHVPYLGHVLLFARSGPGLFTLVIAPGLLLLASGSLQLLREFRGVSSSERSGAADDRRGET